MKHVTGEQLQTVLKPVLDQWDDDVTDASQGLGKSSTESRMQLQETARIHGNKKGLENSPGERRLMHTYFI